MNERACKVKNLSFCCPTQTNSAMLDGTLTGGLHATVAIPSREHGCFFYIGSNCITRTRIGNAEPEHNPQTTGGIMKTLTIKRVSFARRDTPILDREYTLSTTPHGAVGTICDWTEYARRLGCEALHVIEANGEHVWISLTRHSKLSIERAKLLDKALNTHARMSAEVSRG